MAAVLPVSMNHSTPSATERYVGMTQHHPRITQAAAAAAVAGGPAAPPKTRPAGKDSEGILCVIIVCDFQQIQGGQQILDFSSSAGLPESAGDKRVSTKLDGARYNREH